VASGAGNDTITGNGGDDLIFGDNTPDFVNTLGPDGATISSTAVSATTPCELA
jgi:Ca2+-binding RTX toxin-like protein